jgi:hypothetical protein
MTAPRVSPWLAVATWVGASLLAVPAAQVSAAENLSTALGAEWKQLPDWRGVWRLEEPLTFPGPSGSTLAKPVENAKPGRFELGVTPGSYFSGAPYKPEYQKQYDERIANARETGIANDPIDNCYSPHGMPRIMGSGAGAVEFHVTPKETWISWDHMNQTRRIHTDGRGEPGEDQRWPRVMGISIGHWEGQTLVVDTQLMKEGIFDRTGAPHSDQVRMKERITRTAADTITDEMTIEDPVMFTGPWKVTRHFRKSPKKWENVPGTYCAFDAAMEAPK